MQIRIIFHSHLKNSQDFHQRHIEISTGRMKKKRLAAGMGMLPEVQKRRIKMYFFEGMTYEEIAVRENCKHPAVVKSVKAALEKLRIYLEE